jgi:DnaJ-domain-containing protein 1
MKRSRSAMTGRPAARGFGPRGPEHGPVQGGPAQGGPAQARPLRVGFPWPDRDYTSDVLAFLRETHGNIRRDAAGDYYYNSVSTISLHFLLQSSLPAQEVLWRWYLHFDRGRSESIYQTLPPQRDEEFLGILDACAFTWDRDAVRASGLVFLAEHRAEVYLALEELLAMRMDAYRTLTDAELRAALTPKLTWSEVHLRKLVRQMQTHPLTADQRRAIYGLFESDYVRATARHLLDEAASDAFWKQPRPELEGMAVQFATFSRMLLESSHRLGVFVSRQEFEGAQSFGERAAGDRNAGGPGRRRNDGDNGRSDGARDGGRGGSARLQAAEAHFAALGLLPGATVADVKSAYRERVKQYHPDQGGTIQDFLRVQEAYEYLLTEVF